MKSLNIRTFRSLLIVLMAVQDGIVRGETPVFFEDERLKSAVELELQTPDPTPSDMLALETLTAIDQGITDLTGLDYALHLKTLDIHRNPIGNFSPLSKLNDLGWLDLDNSGISDLSALSELRCLRYLNIHGNHIRSLSPLSELRCLVTLIAYNNQIHDLESLSHLTSLQTLHLYKNQIHDLSALSGLTTLDTLILSENQISDISALSGLTNLRALHLYGNQIRNLSALSALSNLETLVLYDNQVSDISPLTGLVSLESLSLEANPLNPRSCSIYIPQILANNRGVQITGPCGFLYPALDVLYVDDDAPSDPLPGDSAGSDPEENGSLEHPFDRIQEAVEVAAEGSEILVLSGVYRERIDLLGKALRLTGMDPNGRGPYPVIAGDGTGPVIRLDRGEDPNCTVMGFVITQGRAEQGSGLYCLDGSPRIRHCLIVGNRSTHPDGAAVYCGDSNAVFEHCTIAENEGGGMVLENSPVHLKDSIVWANGPRSIVTLGSSPTVQFSNVQGGWTGVGSIDLDPLFAQGPAADEPDTAKESEWMRDYHLQSQAGR